MSMTFDKVCALVQRGEVRVSDHGYDEMSDEDILARDVLAGVFNGVGEFRRIYRHRRLS